jgi:hypothetical protein
VDATLACSLSAGVAKSRFGTGVDSHAARSRAGLPQGRSLPDIDYPFHDKTIVVTRCGRICLGRKKINFSQVFAGQAVKKCTTTSGWSALWIMI